MRSDNRLPTIAASPAPCSNAEFSEPIQCPLSAHFRIYPQDLR